MLFVAVFMSMQLAGYLKEFKLKQGETITYFFNSDLFTAFPRIIAIPRLITSLWWKHLKYSPPSYKSPPPPPLAIFSFFYPLPVKLKGNYLIQQNWSVTIQALKIKQGKL